MATISTKRGSLDNIISYEHICDTSDDLLNIPKTQTTLGSVAIVLEGEEGLEVYMANSSKEWIAI